jgi:HAMP domain-containing protein
LGNLVKEFVSAYRRRVHAEPLLARLNALEPRVTAAVERRNEFVHATWAFGAAGVVHRTRRPRRGEVREELTAMRPEHITAVADEIGDVAEAIGEFWDETVSFLGGLPSGAAHLVRSEDWTSHE